MIVKADAEIREILSSVSREIENLPETVNTLLAKMHGFQTKNRALLFAKATPQGEARYIFEQFGVLGQVLGIPDYIADGTDPFVRQGCGYVRKCISLAHVIIHNHEIMLGKVEEISQFKNILSALEKVELVLRKNYPDLWAQSEAISLEGFNLVHVGDDLLAEYAQSGCEYFATEDQDVLKARVYVASVMGSEHMNFLPLNQEEWIKAGVKDRFEQPEHPRITLTVTLEGDIRWRN